MKLNNTETIEVAAQIALATASIKTLSEKMPFLVPLSATERATYKGVGPKTLQTTQARLVAAQNNPAALPGAFDLPQFKEDTEVAAALNECLKAVDQLYSDIRDTLLQRGAAATRAAGEAFGYMRVAASEAAHLKSTVAEMSTRKQRRARTAEEKPALDARASATPAEPTPKPEVKAA